MSELLSLSLLAAGAGILFALLHILWVLHQPDGGAALPGARLMSGKRSVAYAPVVTGGTVRASFTNTAGPAINPMRKVLSLMAVLLVPFLV